MKLWNVYLSVSFRVLITLCLNLIAIVIICLHENSMIRKQQSKNKYDEIKKKVFLKNYLIMCWILRYFTGSYGLFFTYIRNVHKSFRPVKDSFVKLIDLGFICRHCLLICTLFFYNRNPWPWSCLSPRDPHPWIALRWRWRSTDPIFPMGCGRTETNRELSPYRWC